MEKYNKTPSGTGCR